jgi:hypothetical protein
MFAHSRHGGRGTLTLAAKTLACLLALESVFAFGAPWARADEETLVTVLDGRTYRLTIPARELGAEYRPVMLTVSGGMEALISGQLMLTSAYRGAGSEGASLLQQLSACWTTGEVASVDGVRYYVTYAYSFADMELVSEQPALPESLRLHLVRVDGVTAMTPLGDLRPYVEEETGVEPGPPEQAVRTKSMNNLKQLGMAMMMYMNDYDGVAPYAQQTKSCLYVLLPYVKSSDIFSPPRAESRYLVNTKLGGVNERDVLEPARVPLFWEEMPYDDGSRVVGFYDGHVAVIPADEWPGIQEMLGRTYKRAPGMKPLPPDYGVAGYDRAMRGDFGG